ncbi:MAG: hypothetical protein ABH829_05500 [archaeon]
MGDLDDIGDIMREVAGEIHGTDAPKKEDGLKVGKLYRNKRKIIEIINELENQWGGQIPVENIVNKAAEQDIGEEEVNATLDELVRDGYLERPRWMEGIVHRKGRHMLFCPWQQDFPG